jgi:hypothetical protein
VELGGSALLTRSDERGRTGQPSTHGSAFDASPSTRAFDISGRERVSYQVLFMVSAAKRNDPLCELAPHDIIVFLTLARGAANVKVIHQIENNGVCKQTTTKDARRHGFISTWRCWRRRSWEALPVVKFGRGGCAMEFLQGRSAYVSGSWRVDASSVGRLLSGASSALRGGVARIVANPTGSGWSRSPHGRRDGSGRDPQGLKTSTFGARTGRLGVARRGGSYCREPNRVGMEL